MNIHYITTPIYYVNGDPHIGHAHTSIMGDILKRSNLMKGIETYYSTGTDEHGLKNQQAIESSGLDQETYLSGQSMKFKSLFDRLDVSYDFYVRTTQLRHRTVVARVLQILWEKGFLYKKDYTGLYCVGCEQFKKQSDLDESGRCPDHQKAPVQQSETNYFLKLGMFQSWLVGWLREDPERVQPAFYRDEVLAMLEEPLDDLCISRPKNRVWLGIELPFDPDYVTYVWFDALINYISNIGYGESDNFDRFWAHSIHLMAKDIIKTHIIYWPIMLKALDINPPWRYRIHGYWVGEGGQKMSKSLGNVVDPNRVIESVGVDALRYYLAKTMGTTDSQISEALVIACYNTDLANNIGNLHSRVLKFSAKQFGPAVPEQGDLHPDDLAIRNWTAARATELMNNLDLTTIPELARGLIEIADRLNVYVNDKAPWTLAKQPENRERVAGILFAMLDSVRILFELAYPIMPVLARNALLSLGASPVDPTAQRHDFLSGVLKTGTPFGEPINLFPRK